MNNVYTSTTEFKWPEKYNWQILVNLDVNLGLKTFRSFYCNYNTLMKCHKMNMCILYHAYCNKPALQHQCKLRSLFMKRMCLVHGNL